MWTERAQAAQRRGELKLTESWYAADEQSITLAYLVAWAAAAGLSSAPCRGSATGA